MFQLFEPEWILRILCSILMGGLIGYERHTRAREAGVRTHIIVAMTACALMLLSKYGFEGSAKSDPGRIAAQVVSGVGFLGAGLIYVNNGSAHGITTAAGIWATSAVGLLFGAGMYLIALLVSFIMFLAEYASRIRTFNPPYSVMTINVHLDSGGTAENVNDVLRSFEFNHEENFITSDQSGGYYLRTQIRTHKIIEPDKLIEAFKKEEHVLDITIE